tara:strand:+ start:1450 stop:1839 length:390 start_codon:yes stop_codon:yes gene_type:complete
MARSKKTIMKPLKNETLKELTAKVLDLVARTGVEIGHKTDRETLANLSKVFAQDLIQEKRFGNMTFNQVEDAFRLGVRFGKEEPFLNIRTFYRWVYQHKKERIDVATYKVEKLKEKNVPFYQEPIKLLK